MIGYRKWDFDRHNKCLVGAYGAEWHNRSVKSDREPAIDNSSGIYAEKGFPEYMNSVLGAVDLSGRIMVHSDNVIRGQYANILWLTFCGEDLLDEEVTQEDIKVFCREKDIPYVEWELIEEKIEDIQERISSELIELLESSSDQRVLSIPAVSEMFPTVSFDPPLDYSLYAKVKFQICHDSLDYRILDKLSNNISITCDRLRSGLVRRNNHFLLNMIYTRECDESLLRLNKFISSVEAGDEIFIFLNGKGREVYEWMKQHSYYSYNTPESRFVCRRNNWSGRQRIWVYPINGKYKVICDKKISNELSSFDEIIEAIRGRYIRCFCDNEISDLEIERIEGYYEIDYYQNSGETVRFTFVPLRNGYPLNYGKRIENILEV